MPGALREDLDGDGYVSQATGGNDCDDTNALVHPGADDSACDGVDADCYRGDGPDADADLVTVCAGDCDDQDASRAPGSAELCDGVDQDCDGRIDQTFDQDGDGWFDCGGLFAPVGEVALDGGATRFSHTDVGAVIDLDGDGVLELYATGPFEHAAGTPIRAWRWSEPSRGLEPIETVDVVAEALTSAGDIDGDGLDDLAALAIEFGDLQLHVWRSGRPLAGRAPDHTLEIARQVYEVSAFARGGDSDGDGAREISAAWAAPSAWGSGLYALRDGELTAVWVAEPELGAYGGARLTDVGDVNGDGFDDLWRTGGAPVRRADLYLGSGAGPVFSGVVLPRDLPGECQACVSTVADLDGDGAKEFIEGDLAEWGGADFGQGVIRAWSYVDLRAGGSEPWALWRVRDTAAAALGVAMLGDLDGDGNSDVGTVVAAMDERQQFGLAVDVYSGRPRGALLDRRLFQVEALVGLVGMDVADLDGDGAVEVLIFNPVDAGPSGSLDGGADAIDVFGLRGRITVLSTRVDCDDLDASVQRGCRR
jgi:hypothetical protein